MSSDVPWKSCNNSWNSLDKCVIYEGHKFDFSKQNAYENGPDINNATFWNRSATLNITELGINSTNISAPITKTATEEFFE